MRTRGRGGERARERHPQQEQKLGGEQKRRPDRQQERHGDQEHDHKPSGGRDRCAAGGRSGHSGRPGRAGRSGKPGRAGGSGKPGRSGRSGKPAAARLAPLLTLLTLVLAGCGIRATSVPTDVGPAPSRASCALPGENSGTGPTRSAGVPVQVFLVCTAQLVAVERTVQVQAGRTDDPVPVAQALLDQLRTRPPAAEKQAGYTTKVVGALTVTGERPGDPRGTLRLGTPPPELTAYALAQIVCTLANSAAAAGDGSVVLGGPDTAPVLRYRCTPEVRSRPGTTAPPASPATGS